jgi:polygalacturonase
MTPILLGTTPRMAAVRLGVPGAMYDLPEPRSWQLRDANGLVGRGLADQVVLVLDALEPATDYRLDVDGFAAFTFCTRPCAGLIVAELLPDGADHESTLSLANAARLARAVAAVPHGGTLLVPPGQWTALPVALKSGMVLHLSRGAVMRAPSHWAGWPILPARDAGGAMLGSWEGLPDACFAAPLHAIGANGLVIEGRGVLDGGGDRGDWWKWRKETRNGARRPRGLHLVNCSNVTLLGFTIRNAASWTIHPQGCRGLSAYGLTIEAPHDSPNTDGFNPEMCRDVVLEGVRFSVGDDCIAVKAGKRGPSGEGDHLSETRDITVRHCLMERGHGGVVVGSEMSGGVHDVTVEDCEMRGTDRGLRLKTRRGRGGTVSGITMRRCLLSGVQTALSANAHYHCDSDGHDPHVQSRKPAPVDDGTPLITGIHVEEVTIIDLAHAAGCFLGLPEAPVRDVRIRGLRILSTDPNAIPTPPIMADHVRPMRHEGVTAECAQIDLDDPSLLSAMPITSLP